MISRSRSILKHLVIEPFLTLGQLSKQILSHQLKGAGLACHCSCSKEAWMRVLDDAPFAKLFDGSVAVNSHRTVLDVQLLEAPAVVSHKLDPLVRNHFATLSAELLEVRAVLRQGLEPDVSDVALADVERAEPRARSGQGVDGIVADRLAASDVKVPQLVAQPGDLFDACVGDGGALCHGQVAEVGAQLGQFEHSQVGDVAAV